MIVGRFSQDLAVAGGGQCADGRFPHKGLVQPGPEKPQLFSARRDRADHAAYLPHDDLHGGGAGAGDRHHRAAHGDPHPAPGADARQDDPRPPRSASARWSSSPPSGCSGSMCPSRASLSFLFVCTGVYLLSVLGIGLFISTICKTQQQAMMASFFFFQPTVLLSGFATPIENMPLGFQYVTYLSPLALFSRDRPGHLPERGGPGGALAAGPRPLAVGRGHFCGQRHEVQEKTGVRRREWFVLLFPLAKRFDSHYTL